MKIVRKVTKTTTTSKKRDVLADISNSSGVSDEMPELKRVKNSRPSKYITNIPGFATNYEKKSVQTRNMVGSCVDKFKGHDNVIISSEITNDRHFDSPVVAPVSKSIPMLMSTPNIDTKRFSHDPSLFQSPAADSFRAPSKSQPATPIHAKHAAALSQAKAKQSSVYEGAAKYFPMTHHFKPTTSSLGLICTAVIFLRKNFNVVNCLFFGELGKKRIG